MKKSFRISRFALPVLLFILMPFVVAFDFPDTTGVHAKVSGGRGQYSISSCGRGFQSKYMEENVAVHATFATGSEGTSLGERLHPDKTTVGAYGNRAQEELTFVYEEGGVPERPGEPKKESGTSGGAYVQFDWEKFGLQVGAIYLSQWETMDRVHENKVLPTAEVRVGPEYFYGSVSLLSASPVQSGGGELTGGFGGRKGNTRIWAGLSIFPARENSLTLKLSQKLGPTTLSFAGQLAPTKSTYGNPTNEHGVSLGLEIPLSKAW